MEENCFFCKVIFCPFAGIDDENICTHYKKGNMDMGNYQCKCHRCGKIFYGGDLSNWVYKMDGYYFCTWSCFRAYEKEQKHLMKEALKNGKKKTVHR